MSSNEQPCPIWDEPPFPGDIPHGGQPYNSPRAGGRFQLVLEGAHQLCVGSLTDRQKANLSYWIYKHNLDNGVFDDRGGKPLVVDQAWVEGRQDRIPPAEDRLLTFLREMIRSDDANETQPCEELLLAAGGCRHDRDLKELRLNVLDRGLLSGGGGDGPSYPHPGLIELDFDARIYVEERTRDLDLGRQGFVARWFDCSMDPMYEEGIAPAIRDAGYEPRLINDRGFTGGVVDEILAEIRKSKFVVADFTSCGKCTACEKCEHIGARGGVYFEAGFALGLGKTVFLTCHKDRAEAVHFDVNHLNRIEWKTSENLRKELKNSIEAVLGHGPFSPSNGDQEVVGSNSSLAA